MTEEFDWSEFEGKEIVSSRGAVVSYLNDNKDAVIRMQDGPNGHDTWVQIPQDCVPRLIRELRGLCEEY